MHILIIIKTSKLEFLTIIKSSARLFVIMYYDLQNKNKTVLKIITLITFKVHFLSSQYTKQIIRQNGIR